MPVLHFCHQKSRPLSLVGSGHCVWLFPISKCIFVLLIYKKIKSFGLKLRKSEGLCQENSEGDLASSFLFWSPCRFSATCNWEKTHWEKWCIFIHQWPQTGVLEEGINLHWTIMHNIPTGEITERFCSPTQLMISVCSKWRENLFISLYIYFYPDAIKVINMSGSKNVFCSWPLFHIWQWVE